ncbi:MAG: cytochrome c3 family protein [Planctomycetota bacterium]|jgi:predicted CXXCH cytochrome family protein|nr:cytochrome c3 family protein [Planctomycetota bacterium]
MNSLHKKASLLLLGLCAIGGGIAVIKHLPAPRDHARRQVSEAKLPEGETAVLLWRDSKLRRKLAASQTSVISNIRPQDYAGPEACKECHKAKYESWSKHPHRWMNALASPTTVKGDFNDFSLSYLGGKIRQYKLEDEFRVDLTREDVRRTFKVTQTIGSRIFQFYIGTLLEGPEPASHLAYRKEILLPVGWWITRKEWMPPTGVGFGDYDHDFIDPFERTEVIEYAGDCIKCHTTIPIGEWLMWSWVKAPESFEEANFHKIKPYSFYVPGYMADAHPEKVKKSNAAEELARLAVHHLKALDRSVASDIAVNLGISCEACHYGCAEHVKDKEVLPAFFPSGRSLLTHEPAEYGRTAENKRAVCARCHGGDRPVYAAGMSTFNSAEFSDAIAGSCYSKLACSDCHNPHKATGVRWQRSPEDDDALCQNCHEIKGPKQIEAHTHHQPGTEGSRCMNCHMPPIVEGLEKVTRTHAIFSPTNEDMIGTGHPNACNLCHLEKTVQWTVDHLNDWYGKDIADLPAKSPFRTNPAGTQWIKEEHHRTQLAATWAITSKKQFWALPDILTMLDHPGAVFRHISSAGIEQMTGKRLSEKGYHFYQKPAVRKRSVERVREWLLNEFPTGKQAQVDGN